VHHYRRNRAAAERFAGRRQREDEAPRLTTRVPDLTSLSLSIEERTGANTLTEPKYLRRIVVTGAPALFLLPCGDPRCNEGGHDVTSYIMSSLMRREGSFHGEDACSGSLGAGPCLRVLYYQGAAEYRERTVSK
jgi:hypothetical protein